jgi:hypothetical protein
MKKDVLSEICVALLILLFSYTAVSKFLDQYRFVFQMRLAPLPLMKSLAPVLGWLMPLIESLIVVGLLIPVYRLKALYVSVILLCSFEIYITGMLLSGLQLPCTCGGIISRMSWSQHLVFNAVFIGISFIAISGLRRSSGRSVNKRTVTS